jgi:adenine-specific DNA-methyltransferase
MTYWEGLTIKTETKLKCYETDHESLTKDNVYDFFKDLFERAGHFPYWIISYRDHAYPSEKEMKDIIMSFGRTCNVVRNFYQYTIAGKRTPASSSIEYLFICKKESQVHLNLPRYAQMNNVLPRPDRFLKRTQ